MESEQTKIRKGKIEFNHTVILAASVIFTLGRLILYWASVTDVSTIRKYINPLLAYKEYFDLCVFLFFIFVVYCFIQESGDIKLSASILLNFLNTIVCWSYIPDIWNQIKAGISNITSSIAKWLGASDKHILYVITVALFIALSVIGIKKRTVLSKCVKALLDNMKQYLILWIILGVLSVFLIQHLWSAIGYLFGFDVSKIQEIVKQSEISGILISGCSLICLAIRIAKERKKFNNISNAVAFIDICLCVWGLSALRSYMDVLSVYFTWKRFAAAGALIAVCFGCYKLYKVLDWTSVKMAVAAKSKWILAGILATVVSVSLLFFNYKFRIITKIEFFRWLSAVSQIFLFIVVVLLFVLLLVLLGKIVRSVYKKDITDKLGKLLDGFFRKETNSKIAICIGCAIVLAAGVAMTIILVQWGEKVDFFQENGTDYLTQTGKIGTFLGIIMMFVAFCMLIFLEIILFVKKAIEEIKNNEQKSQRWFLLFLSAILTILSIYFYNKSDMDDWEYLSIAGNVFGVFAVPVILMTWYVIMNGLINSVESILDTEEIKESLKKELSNLIPMFISSIFAPFYFLVDFGADLRSAVVDIDDSDPDDWALTKEDSMKKQENEDDD